MYQTARSFRLSYMVVAGVFAGLVLGIVFLFGHLIAGSLSRQYIDDVLVSGSAEAQDIAREIAEESGLDQETGSDLFAALASRRETIMRRLSGLPQRHVVESIKVTDREGELVYEFTFQSREDLPEEMAADLELSSNLGDQTVSETTRNFEFRAPLGEVGEVVLNFSKNRLAQRVALLRRNLLQQTLTAAILTLAALVIAALIVWLLIQRTRRLEAQRHEAEEMAALGSLAANLAHEIRNPLNSINLNLELLEEDLEGQEAGASLQTTRTEVGRLARLVSDFLTYARPSQPSLSTLKAGPLLNEVVDFLSPEARTMGVHLRLASGTSGQGGLTISGDGAQLRQVLLNLTLNAVQAVADLTPDSRVVELAAARQEAAALLIVRDRGRGIPDEQLQQVRRAFHSLRRGGSGLGLAIVDRIVSAHGGRLELANLSPGFEARVILPFSAEDGKIGG